MSRFLAKALRLWPVCLLLLIGLPTLLTVIGRERATVYQSTALLYVARSTQVAGGSSSSSASDFDPYASPARNGANAMSELTQSQSFLVAVAAATDLAHSYDLASTAGRGDVATRLTKELTIAPTDAGENTFSVTVEDKNAQLAQQIADALVKQFLSYSAQHQLQNDRDAQAFLNQQLSAAQSKASESGKQLSDYLQAHPALANQTNDTTTDPQLAQLRQQYTQDQNTVKQLNDELNSVLFDMAAAQAGTSSVYSVLDQPQLPLKPTIKTKSALVYTGGGLAAALVILGLLLGAQTWRDRKLYSSRDLRAALAQLDGDLASVIETLPEITVERPAASARRRGGNGLPAPDGGALAPALRALPRRLANGRDHDIRHALTDSAMNKSERTEDISC